MCCLLKWSPRTAANACAPCVGFSGKPDLRWGTSDLLKGFGIPHNDFPLASVSLNDVSVASIQRYHSWTQKQRKEW